MFICCCTAVWSIYIIVVHWRYRLSRDTQLRAVDQRRLYSFVARLLSQLENPLSLYFAEIVLRTHNTERNIYPSCGSGLIYPHFVQTFPLTSILKLLLLCSQIWSLIAQCKSSMFILFKIDELGTRHFFDLFREQMSSLQKNLGIFPSLFQDLCDMLVANRLYILNHMIWLIIHLV